MAQTIVNYRLIQDPKVYIFPLNEERFVWISNFLGKTRLSCRKCFHRYSDFYSPIKGLKGGFTKVVSTESDIDDYDYGEQVSCFLKDQFRRCTRELEEKEGLSNYDNSNKENVRPTQIKLQSTREAAVQTRQNAVTSWPNGRELFREYKQLPFW